MTMPRTPRSPAVASVATVATVATGPATGPSTGPAPALPSAPPAFATGPDTPVGDFLPWLPVRHVGARGWTSLRQRLFIDELTQHGSVRRAAATVGKTARSAYQLRGKPGAEHFAVTWDAAVMLGTIATAGALLPRVMEGELVPVFRQGRQVGVRVRHDDRLALAVLRARQPSTSPADVVLYALEQYEVALRRRELDLLEREAGRDLGGLRAAEDHELLARAIAAEDRAERQRAVRRQVQKVRAASRMSERTFGHGPQVRVL